MSASKTLKGEGKLIGEDDAIGEEVIGYSISVGSHRGLTSGLGFIYASEEVLWNAYEGRGGIRIKIGDDELNVLVRSYEIGTGRAEVVTTGPIPGF